MLCLRCRSAACPHAAPDRQEVLSDYELSIIRLVEAGETNKTAAHKLQTTEDAVKQALHRIYRKLRLDTEGNARVRLAHWAASNQSLLTITRAA